MTGPIHVLVCEDSDDDALLVATRLRRDGIALSYERVDTAAAADRALRDRPPDLVISDFNMPTFSAHDALTLLQAAQLDVPFILVSGQIGEESTAALLRAGAHDVVLKDRLARLAPAVERELREAHGRRQRHRAEAALRESEQRFRLFAEHAPDIMFRYRLHPDPGIEYLSPACTQVLGHPPSELAGDPQRLFSLLDRADRSPLEDSWRSPNPRPLVVRWHRPDGRVAWTEQRAVGIRDEAGDLVAIEGILRDVTDQVTAKDERDQLERQLRQTERLDAVGQLAGGVAHDFNNLLGVILAYTDIAADELPPEHPLQEELGGIQRAAQRGAALTRQLLLFSRLEPPELEVLDLNAVVQDTERLLRRTIGEDLDFRTELDAGLPPIRIDRTRLEQIVVNLVVNARAAMPQGGRLTLRTARSPAPDPGGPDRPVQLEVIDSGCGMPAEVVERAFEPFFTTKGPGGGTGLGLSTVYGAVTEAGGEIAILSTPGSGTTIRIRLPAAPSAAASGPQTPVARPATDHADARGHGETILLTEDEDDLRELLHRTLSDAGYRVIDHASPAEALKTAADQTLPLDALVTDVIMPGMSGPQLAERIRHDRPVLPVLFMSGYTAGSLPSSTPLPPGAPLIRKPFTRRALLDRLRVLLDEA